MSWKLFAGLALGLVIGLGCNLLGVPVPAPPALAGAALVVAMTVGYQLTDRIMTEPARTHPGACGGPSGSPSSSDRKS